MMAMSSSCRKQEGVAEQWQGVMQCTCGSTSALLLA
jgi:hypothetical protein